MSGSRQAPPPDPEPTPNPALAVVEPERTAQEYEVIGPRAVHETDPGGTFTALLTPGQESALIEGGHIKLTNPKEGA